MIQLQRLRPLLGCILLLLWSLILLNGVVYRHTHKLKNGRIISHAHPYKSTNSKLPYQPNNHTDNELLLIDALSNAVFTSLSTTILGFLVVRNVVSIVITDCYFFVNRYTSSSRFLFHLRGPPVVFC
jgi:hypothetical protein